MKAKTSAIAQKLLNLYRQEHVIVGGWTAVNQVFVAEATPDVIADLENLPTGKMLIQHIQNLRSGKTPMDSIDHDLVPYGGMMTPATTTSILNEEQLQTLTNALNTFTTDQSGLDKFQSMPVVQQFGNEWIVAITAALASHPELAQGWDKVVQTYRAYKCWSSASSIVNEPISERTRAQLQADMPEYETYLPMFGDAGTELLNKLRTFISTREVIA